MPGDPNPEREHRPLARDWTAVFQTGAVSRQIRDLGL
jgi:hypothetical protein